MAMAWTINHSFVVGDRKMVLATGTFDSSYPTGGEPITASDFGLSSIHHVGTNAPTIADEAINGVVWDKGNSTLIVIVAAGTQEGAATDLSATTVECMVVGV